LKLQIGKHDESTLSFTLFASLRLETNKA